MPEIEFKEDAEVFSEEVYAKLGESAVKLDTNFSHVVILDGLPVVTTEKFEKLLQVLNKKLFPKLPKLVDGASYYMPMDENNKETLGCMFLEFNSNADARIAIRDGDKFAFDKKHTLRMTLWEDFEQLMEMEEKYEPPKLSDYGSKGNLKSWLQDDLGRDMFALRHAKETQIFWNDPIRGGSVLAYGGETHKEQGKSWTDLYITWSPNGLYLATYHRQGIALWGGENFERIQRFPHEMVRLIDFSPCERYIITFNAQETDLECFIVWDIRSGKQLRSFPGDDLIVGQWPIFKWSHDGNFVARKFSDAINIYETPSMNLIKQFKIPQVADFDWSPSDYFISYYVPELEDAPATVSIIQFPSMDLVREKRYFSVMGLHTYWQSGGDYLCVRVGRTKGKSKPKLVSTNFEIFKLREKNVPVEVVEVTDPPSGFAWEPKGHRFALITGESSKSEVSIYKVSKQDVRLEHTIKDKQPTALLWSPAGDVLLMTNIGSPNVAGTLQFYSANEKLMLASREHYGCIEVHWDPSGRYVCSAGTQPLTGPDSWKFAMNNGFKIWSVSGNLLHEKAMDRLYQFLWRPRPASLLNDKEIKTIKKEMRSKYWKQFEQEDEKARTSQLAGEAKKRADMKAAWKAYRSEREVELKEKRLSRGLLLKGVDDDWEEMQVTVEEEMSVIEEILDIQ